MSLPTKSQIRSLPLQTPVSSKHDPSSIWVWYWTECTQHSSEQIWVLLEPAWWPGRWNANEWMKGLVICDLCAQEVCNNRYWYTGWGGREGSPELNQKIWLQFSLPLGSSISVLEKFSDLVDMFQVVYTTFSLYGSCHWVQRLCLASMISAQS
jgi:hypothetical protein